MNNQEDLETQLDAFDAEERRNALVELVSRFADALPPAGTNVNMHVHSFFSFNAVDWSPSHIAWEARKMGLYAAGLCDFDVLDGLEEFLEAGRLTGLRATVNLETRAYMPEFATVDISSPGEPGVAYVMGAGFARLPAAGGAADEGLRGYRDRAQSRNLELIGRVNAALSSIAIDYDTDVLPLTPGGCPTERHIVRAYVNKSRDAWEHPRDVAEFWSGVLKRDVLEVLELMADTPAMEEAVRARLAKRGGVGYVAPSADTFPPMDAFIAWAASCGAVPMTTWLDGTSGGERDPRFLLELMGSKGAAALNIIPDRNWNIADPDVRAVKIANLAAIVAAAEDMQLPINIGTEMNKQGLPAYDDLDVEALAPHKEAFLRGARIMVGHTALARYADYGYLSEAARGELPNVAERNRYFERVGALPPLTAEQGRELCEMGVERARTWFRDAVRI